ncbi:MAG: lipopolysaccharide biosynthesis protein [Muribaculaceae bacterium]|nr:lipopolysaccharide biosynthesis protein [Muribaculaceae bacterium]
MVHTDSNKKRVAKNTIYLYGRMILLMAVSLYTSRVVLNALGIEDFGVYNVVGGVVAMIGFLNSSLITSTQRFLNVEMGHGDAKTLNETFIQAVNAHVIIAIIAAVLLETIGLWFVMNKLVIPEGQLNAALWVFQCSILSFIITIISAPYNAAIIANERMSLFAILSIVDAVMKLAVAFVVGALADNKLKIYALLILATSIIMRFVYSGCCVRLFKECKYHLILKWSQMKQMFSFSGWMIFGCLSDILASQGVNMLINIFFGPIFNAARAIAAQVQGAVSQFSVNFMMSVNPQIVKSYSSGAVKDSFELVFQSSKLSFFLMLMVAMPLIVRMQPILTIWLKEVPDYAALFAQLILVEYLIRSSYTPIAQINYATGNVRLYQFSIACLFIVTFVGSYILYKLGFPVYSTFILAIIVAAIGLLVRLLILRKQSGFPMGEYLRKVTLPLSIVFLLSISASLLINSYLPDSFMSTLAGCLSAVIVSGIFAWTIGLTKTERSFVMSKFALILNKIR